MNQKILRLIVRTLKLFFIELLDEIDDHDGDDSHECCGGNCDSAESLIAAADTTSLPPVVQEVPAPQTHQPPAGLTVPVVTPPAPTYTGTPIPPVPGETVTQNYSQTVAPPTPSPVAPVPSTGGAELDSEGRPWDERIHSSGKTFYKSKSSKGAPAGSWKWKKGITAEYVAQIYGETTPEPEVAAPVSPPTPTPTPTPAPAQTLPAYGSVTKWGELMRLITINKIDKVLVDAYCQQKGVKDVAELQNNPALIPVIVQAIGLTL